jgi:hypothetical protein
MDPECEWGAGREAWTRTAQRAVWKRAELRCPTTKANKLLYDAWKDYTTSDDMIALFNGKTWTKESAIPLAVSAEGPGLGAYAGRLFATRSSSPTTAGSRSAACLLTHEGLSPNSSNSRRYAVG